VKEGQTVNKSFTAELYPTDNHFGPIRYIATLIQFSYNFFSNTLANTTLTTLTTHTHTQHS